MFGGAAGMGWLRLLVVAATVSPPDTTTTVPDLRTGTYSEWGRLTDSGQWTANCASTQMPASAARYYRLDLGTPGRFAGGTLPIKIELTSYPSASTFLLAGTDPASATLLHFGSSAPRTVVSGNPYGLGSGSYLLEVATSQVFNPTASNNLISLVGVCIHQAWHRL